MALRDPRPGLRAIHNGSNAVAKAELRVAAGDTLEVSDEVAAQLFAQASGAFKDGPAPVVEPAAEASEPDGVKPVKAKPAKPAKPAK